MDSPFDAPAPRYAFVPERLAAVGACIEGWVQDGTLPHAAILVVRGAQTALDLRPGLARYDGTPVRAETAYRLASLGKPIMSALFLGLVEAGLVALDTPLHSVVPELCDLRVWRGPGHVLSDTEPASRPVVIADLLRHTAGFTYSFQHHDDLDRAYREKKIDDMLSSLSEAERLAALAKLPLASQPGSKWRYSMSTDLLGIVAQRVSGRPLDQLVASFGQQIGAPGLAFQAPDGGTLADAWLVDARRGLRLYDRATRGGWSKPPAFPSAGGGLIGTMDDVLAFAKAATASGGSSPLSPGVVDGLTRNQLPDDASLEAMAATPLSEAPLGSSGFSYGFAVTSRSSALRREPHAILSWGSLFGSWLMIDPERELIVILMTQAIGCPRGMIRKTLETLVYAALVDTAST